ncbi:hypothetical protein [Burkholderia stagnalis]|uniref:hypothetical protein n=1 Tax=Burkholderia stagnalis TaxID=1503054 RepID=UPI000AB6C5F5|nr:hypothetical protein [Burkholderia stagnalis]
MTTHTIRFCHPHGVRAFGGAAHAPRPGPAAATARRVPARPGPLPSTVATVATAPASPRRAARTDQPGAC